MILRTRFTLYISEDVCECCVDKYLVLALEVFLGVVLLEVSGGEGGCGSE
jgi:hypothetical protein